MSRALAAVAVLLSCEATPSPTREPPQRPPEAPAPQRPAPTALPREPAPTSAARPEPPPAAASLCVRMCEAQGQARAVAAEVISRECEVRCASATAAPCDASEARRRVESVSMNRRASKVWTELGDPALYCGYQDAFTRGLRAAATHDLDARREALGRALAADPYPADTCPTEAEVPLDATAAEAIEACGIDEPEAGWHRDVDAASFLALRAVRLRFEAAGLYAADRKVLVQTGVLSTALASED